MLTTPASVADVHQIVYVFVFNRDLLRQLPLPIRSSASFMSPTLSQSPSDSVGNVPDFTEDLNIIPG